MEQQTSALLQRLSESATIAMARKARELKDQGVDVISLSLGEPDFDTPSEMKQAGIDAIEANETHYTPVPGTPRVRKAIVDKFKRDNGLEYTMDQVVVSTGAKQSLANVVLSLVDPGDEVILPAPYWVSYEEIVKVAGGVPVVLPTSIDNDYKIQPRELEAAITPKTRIVMYSSPCNPSGSVYTEAETAALADVLRQHDRIITVSDEIYELINFTDKHASMAAQPGMWERTVTVNGISKGFAMTGWRLGYIGAPTWIAAACTKIQGQFTSAPSSITQAAAAAALEAQPTLVSDMVDAFRRRRALMVDGLSQVPGFKVNQPMGAFYVFPDVSALFGKSFNGKTLNDANDVAFYLLEEAKVASVSGAAFGTPECIRLSYAAADDVLQEAVRRIDAACRQLTA
ncbi:pyridoxal phosphate-dependent aminotransferase [Flavobacteriales bacterium]|nr:pyridoxal phosphate-dependent aminotransferase [Flavobacteriales bacterium]MEC8336271.1 pyridoxal phosphate-dependent aminotransferase [Bacteroidota bacterium]MEC8663811.1 pyridoxal phosphate-dependent aminotransferase [Bacteroidota bacterium]